MTVDLSFTRTRTDLCFKGTKHKKNYKKNYKKKKRESRGEDVLVCSSPFILNKNIKDLKITIAHNSKLKMEARFSTSIPSLPAIHNIKDVFASQSNLVTGATDGHSFALKVSFW